MKKPNNNPTPEELEVILDEAFKTVFQKNTLVQLLNQGKK